MKENLVFCLVALMDDRVSVEVPRGMVEEGVELERGAEFEGEGVCKVASVSSEFPVEAAFAVDFLLLGVKTLRLW